MPEGLDTLASTRMNWWVPYLLVLNVWLPGGEGGGVRGRALRPCGRGGAGVDLSSPFAKGRGPPGYVLDFLAEYLLVLTRRWEGRRIPLAVVPSVDARVSDANNRLPTLCAILDPFSWPGLSWWMGSLAIDGKR